LADQRRNTTWMMMVVEVGRRTAPFQLGQG
jgi:hypothetical protein